MIAELVVLGGLAIAAVLYGIGMARLQRRTVAHRRDRRAQALAFWTGWAVLALALLSPLHHLGASLLAAHMLQHELLMIVAAPLLVLGRPWIVSVWGLPRGWRPVVGRGLRRARPFWRFLSRLEIAWLLHAVAILAWHAPGLYQRTMTSDLMHALQHTSFLVTGLLFWWSVLVAAPRRRLHGPAIASLFSTMIYTGGLGALLTLARLPWYPAYGEAAPAWGLTQLEDQQLAGLIMWAPGGITYLLATLWLVLDWLRISDGRVTGITVPRAGPIQDRS